jgi:hypothetical protein
MWRNTGKYTLHYASLCVMPLGFLPRHLSILGRCRKGLNCKISEHGAVEKLLYITLTIEFKFITECLYRVFVQSICTEYG